MLRGMHYGFMSLRKVSMEILVLAVEGTRFPSLLWACLIFVVTTIFGISYGSKKNTKFYRDAGL